MACSYNQHQSVLLYYVNHVDIPPGDATLSSASPQAVSRCALLKSNMEKFFINVLIPHVILFMKDFPFLWVNVCLLCDCANQNACLIVKFM